RLAPAAAGAEAVALSWVRAVGRQVPPTATATPQWARPRPLPSPLSPAQYTLRLPPVRDSCRGLRFSGLPYRFGPTFLHAWLVPAARRARRRWGGPIDQRLELRASPSWAPRAVVRQAPESLVAPVAAAWSLADAPAAGS